jgi:hypothetical protein
MGGRLVLAVLLSALTLTGWGFQPGLPEIGQPVVQGQGQPDGYSDRICDTPENLTGPVDIAGGQGGYGTPAIVWDGAAYGVLWFSTGSLYFVRVAADGTPLASPTLISSERDSNGSAIAWTGSEFVVAWSKQVESGNTEIFLTWLSASGIKVGNDLRVTTNAGYSQRPTLACGGNTCQVVWEDSRDARYQIYSAQVVDKAKVGGDVRITDNTSVCALPSLVWQSATPGYGYLAYTDDRNGKIQTFLTVVSYAGTTSSTVRITTDGNVSSSPSLVWTGTECGIAWYDSRTTSGDIYFARFRGSCSKVGSDVQITSNAATQNLPSLAWTGSEFGVVWQDTRDGGAEIYFCRISSSGAKVGSDVRLTYLDQFPEYPKLAFGSLGYGMTYEQYSPRASNFSGLGCHDDTTPPSCPNGVSVTANGGSGVTLGWASPGEDNETELAYHRVYRDGAAIGVTTAAAYTDTPRPSGTPSYTVEAVNARGWRSTGCTVVTAPPPIAGCGQDWTGAQLVSATSGSATASVPSVAWDGAGYGIAWQDNRDGNDEIYFSRVGPDGTIIVPATRVTNDAGTSKSPSIVWTGSEYGLAYSDSRSGAQQIYFARLSLSGSKIGGLSNDCRISDDFNDCRDPSLVWAGSFYGVAWAGIGPTIDVYFRLINADGTTAGSTLAVTASSGICVSPTLAWSGAEFGVAWQSQGSGNYEIYFRRITAAGALAGSQLKVTEASDDSIYPSLTWDGTEYGLVWEDYRNTWSHAQVFFARVSALGFKVGSEIVLTPTGTNNAISPSVTWSGSEFIVVWSDNATLNYELYDATLDSEGYLLGSTRRLTTHWATDREPALVAGGYGFGVAFARDVLPDQILFMGLGCGSPDITPPSCPGAPAEMARTMNPDHTVTLGWGLSVDPDCDLGHYLIYRSGEPYGASLATQWTDTAFSPSAGYIYQVLAVNAAGAISTGCSWVDTSDHVQPTCVGGLFGSLSGSTVTLDWAPAWDAKSGVQKYNVYRNGLLRGNSPVGTNTYSDGVSPSSNYVYLVETVDWANNNNPTCSAYWVSTSSILLHVTKHADGTNADLDWNDVGLPEYVVYRSADPQAFTERQRVTDSQTQDPVLQDGVRLWYYLIQQRE